jgi:WD40 repeat protein
MGNMEKNLPLSLFCLFLVHLCAWGQVGSDPVSLTGHNAPVTAIAFSPDNLRLATADSNSPTVWIRSVVEKEVLSKLIGPKGKKASITRLAYSPDGKWLAACSYDFVAVWNVTAGKKQIEYIPGKGRSVYDFSFFSKEQLIAVALTDSITVFSLNDGKLIKTHAIHDGAVALSASANGLFLWKGEIERSGLMLDIHSGRVLKEFKGGHTKPARFSRFVDGDRKLVTAGFDGRVVFWDQRRQRFWRHMRLMGPASLVLVIAQNEISWWSGQKTELYGDLILRQRKKT